MIALGFFSLDEPGLLRPLPNGHLRPSKPHLCGHRSVDEAPAILKDAKMGLFSSYPTVLKSAEGIWGMKPLK